MTGRRAALLGLLAALGGCGFRPLLAKGETDDSVRDRLAAINRDHATTLLLTSHDMDDIEALCTRVMLINHGRLLMDGTVGCLNQRQRFGDCRRSRKFGHPWIRFDGPPTETQRRCENC